MPFVSLGLMPELTRALAIAGVATPIDPSDRAKITLSLDCGGRIVRFGD